MKPEESAQKPFSDWLGPGADNYEAVFKAIETGKIEAFDRAQLLTCARILSSFMPAMRAKIKLQRPC